MDDLLLEIEPPRMREVVRAVRPAPLLPDMETAEKIKRLLKKYFVEKYHILAHNAKCEQIGTDLFLYGKTGNFKYEIIRLISAFCFKYHYDMVFCVNNGKAAIRLRFSPTRRQAANNRKNLRIKPF